MDKDEYRRRVEFNEREIAHWEATTTDSQQLALQLTMCLQVVSNINRLWTVSSDEDRQGMVRHFFDYVVYDLDQQEIVDFRLKAWADQFLYVKASVMGIEDDLLSSHDNSMTPTGYQPSPRYLVIEFRIHRVAAPPRAQVEDPAKIQIRQKVLELRGMGMSYPNIASILNISIGTAWNYANHKL